MYRTIRIFLITFVVLQLLRSTIWIWMKISEITNKTLKTVILARHWLSWLHHPCGTQQRGIYSWQVVCWCVWPTKSAAKKTQIKISCLRLKKHSVPPHKLANPLTGRRVFGSSLGWKATMASSATAAWSSSKMADTKRCSSAMEKNYTP